MTKKHNESPRDDFKLHVGLIGFVALYFGGLLYWFGSLLLRGGTAERAIMSVVVPVVLLLGLVAVMGLSIIAVEGRRSARVTAQKAQGDQATREEQP